METLTLPDLLALLGFYILHVLGLYVYVIYFDSCPRSQGAKPAAANIGKDPKLRTQYVVHIA